MKIPTKLVDAQRIARANKIKIYYRLIVPEAAAGRGGWWNELDPRERFFFDRIQLDQAIAREIGRMRRFDVSFIKTDETSDSPNAR